jgi:hypothetical protein
MSDEKSKALDILGIQPIAASIEKLTTAVVDGAAATLSRICLPAAEEFGLLLQDRVRYWRALNIAKLAMKTESKLKALKVADSARAHPRIVSKILEEGSWSDDESIQEMWAGLLASACSEDGNDDSNLIFISLLANLSKSQARLVGHSCNSAEKFVNPGGLVLAQYLYISLEDLKNVTGESDIHRLDREMDHLRALNLIDGGFHPDGDAGSAQVTPTALSLHLFARCAGFRGSPVEFFMLSMKGKAE